MPGTEESTVRLGTVCLWRVYYIQQEPPLLSRVIVQAATKNKANKANKYADPFWIKG